jgi:hypothetical protein
MANERKMIDFLSDLGNWHFATAIQHLSHNGPDKLAAQISDTLQGHSLEDCYVALVWAIERVLEQAPALDQGPKPSA